MSFWREEVIDFALDHETKKHIQEQLNWIAREPANPKPYYHLAQLYRMQRKQEEGLALLLEAARLDHAYAEAHLALVEIYTVREDYAAAWRHAQIAARHGNHQGVLLLTRYGVPQPDLE